MLILLVFILGLVVGSFLNVVVLRLKNGSSITFDRSRCVLCKHLLSPLDLLPLASFFLLHGRCRYCHKQISWQYPIVEFLTGLLFVLAWIKFQPSIWDTALTLAFGCLLVVIAVYDFKYYTILDKLVLPAFGLILLLNLYTDLVHGYALKNSTTILGLLGSLIVSGFFLVQYVLSKGKWIGFGDVKLGLFLGSLLGFSGSLLLLFLSYVSGGIVALGLLKFGKKSLSSPVPFGIFLAFSAIVTMLYGEEIIRWYLKLIL